MRNILILMLAVLLFLPGSGYGFEKLPGKYELVGDVNKAFNKKQVVMTEFFNFSCAHCYKFLTSSKVLTKKYGGKLIHKKVPIYWGKQSPYPAMAFYMAEEKNIANEVTQNIFDANFLGGAQVFDPRVLNFIISESGLTEDIRKQSYLGSKVQAGLDLASKYKANETPTIILNGAIKVTPRLAGGDVEKMTKNLDLIISKLLSK